MIGETPKASEGREVKPLWRKICYESLLPSQVRIMEGGEVIGRLNWSSEFDSFGGEIVMKVDNKYYVIDWFLNERTWTRHCDVLGPFSNLEQVIDKISYLTFLSKERVRKKLGLKQT